ncbi:MAG: hypothetical protein PF480_02870 [Roseovarius sp.]|nr:hypothetical protein [Roseovarius sp.]
MTKFMTTSAVALALAGCVSMADYQLTGYSDRDKEVHDRTLKLELKDYQSAQFLGEPRVAVNPKGGRIICGALNAKNSFGGYNGFKAYAVQYVPSNPAIGPIFYIGDAAAIDCQGAGINVAQDA